MGASRFAAAVCVTAIVMLATAGCDTPHTRLRVDHEPTPAGGASLLPQTTALWDGRIAASWLEPLQSGGYRFQMALRTDGQWSETRTIAAGSDLVMFSADVPGLLEMTPGRLLAYFQRFDRSGADPYATTIQLSQSTDDGQSWSTPVVPHDDGVFGSHAFIAAFPDRGRAGLVWLDAKHQRHVMPTGGQGQGSWMGAMGLRYTAVDHAGALHDNQFVDTIVCECCPNTATLTDKGPLIAFRDRAAAPGAQPELVGADAGTVRDIHVARLEDRGWTPPVRVHADNWVVNACPDNGPALDARGADAVIAWWTLAGGTPAVKVAFSPDSGTTWGRPVHVDQGKGNGQVTVAILADGRSAVVGWLEDRQTWARIVRADGFAGEPVSIGRSPSRNRLPRWIATDNGVLALWTREDSGALSAQVATLRLEP